MMEESINNLPPTKRFKLLNQQQPQSQPRPPPPCLPAKKRVWAPPPHSPLRPKPDLDLNKPIIEAPEIRNEKKIEAGKEEVDTIKIYKPVTENRTNPKFRQAKLKEEEEDDIVKIKKSVKENPTKPKSQQQKCKEHDVNNKTPITHKKNSETEIKEGDEEEDGIVCVICNITDADPTNPIVFCDGCDLQVHAMCYGNPLIKSIPDDDWFCALCSMSSKKKSNTQGCCLCFKTGGALKPTTDDKWAHVVCALYVPEVYFKDSEGRDMICCEMVPADERRVSCYLCGCTSGCGIRCAEVGCGLEFHVSCGVEKGLCIEFMERRCGGIVAGFCQVHSKIWEKEQLTGKFKIVARENSLKRKTRN